MPNRVNLTPLTSANTNDFGMTFDLSTDSAYIELLVSPEATINKNLSGVELISVNNAGVVIKKNAFNALVPWENIIILKY